MPSGILREEPGVFWRGLGPGNFGGAYLRHKLPQASEEVSDPHNLFLETWTTAGVGAALAVAAALGLGLRETLGPPKETGSVEAPSPAGRTSWLLLCAGGGWFLAARPRDDQAGRGVWVAAMERPPAGLGVGGPDGRARLATAADPRRRAGGGKPGHRGQPARGGRDRLHPGRPGALAEPCPGAEPARRPPLRHPARHRRPWTRLRPGGRGHGPGRDVPRRVGTILARRRVLERGHARRPGPAATLPGGGRVAGSRQGVRSLQREALAEPCRGRVSPLAVARDAGRRRGLAADRRRLAEGRLTPRNPDSLTARRREAGYARQILQDRGSSLPETTRKWLRERAVNALAHAVRLYPTSATLRAELAEASAEGGHVQDAIHQAEVALDLDRGTPHADKRLAEEVRGRLVEGLRRWRSDGRPPRPSGGSGAGGGGP